MSFLKTLTHSTLPPGALIFLGAFAIALWILSMATILSLVASVP